MNRAQVFLKAYRKTGSITAAAEAAKIDRSMHYRRYKADPKYRKAFDDAKEEAIGVLEDAALRRAVEGEEEPVIWQGMLCTWKDEKTGQSHVLTVNKKSDSLLQFLLRGAKPEKYRERHQVNVKGDLKVTKFKGDMQDLLNLYRNLTQGEPDDDEEKES